MTAEGQPLTKGCITDLDGLATTFNQLHGTGVVRMKSLIVPYHFGNQVSSIQYVQVPCGSSIGTHLQQETDELYFLLEGTGELITNREASLVQTGDLILAPRFTWHAIENVDSSDELTFLAIEVSTRSYVGCVPTTIHDLYGSLRPTTTLLSARIDEERAPFQAFTLDLMKYFTGGWDHLSIIELPAFCHLDAYTLTTQDENLLVYEGQATIEVDNQAFHTNETSSGRLNAYVSTGVSRRILNTGPNRLRVLSVRFHNSCNV